MNVDAYPLSWPVGRPRARSRSEARFGKRSWSADGNWGANNLTFGRARDELMAELDRLGARSIVLSTNIPLKADGMPYASGFDRHAVREDPGVAVYFQFKGKSMVFACDSWKKIEHNVWAIAKTIDALRGIARWGTGDMLERAFSGFAALPSSSPPERKWWEVLECHPEASADMVRVQYQKLAQRHHPDRGGNPQRMAEINRARDEAAIALSRNP